MQSYLTIDKRKAETIFIKTSRKDKELLKVKKKMKMKNVYFQTHRSFYIIFSEQVLNRYQRFIHSVGGFKKLIYRYTNQANIS